MTVENQEQLEGLQAIGRVVAQTIAAMREAVTAGMTTRELDAIGAALLEREGARSAPALCYGFPGATCVSVFPAIAHGVPGDRVIEAGDLVNVDVSAERDGYFADSGASFVVPPIDPVLETLCRDGQRALWTGIRRVRAGAGFREIGRAIADFAHQRDYSLIENLASHGVGRALHEEPTEIATWFDPTERRRIEVGQVFTLEPFLSRGARRAVEGDDGWTLYANLPLATVQYEHTLVATRKGALITTLAA